MKILLLNKFFNTSSQPATQDQTPNLFGIKSLDDLHQFVTDGGKFSTDARNRLKMTQAMIIAIIARQEGLKLFAEKNGVFNDKAKDVRGRTEAMWVAGYTGIEGLKLLAEQGHKFNPAARDNHGRTEAMWVADYAGLEGLEILAKKTNIYNSGLLEDRYFTRTHYAHLLNEIPAEVQSPKATQLLTKSSWLPTLRNS